MTKDIYIIKNTVNDKVYVGQTKDAEKRWLSHIYNARYENHSPERYSQELHKDMMKYGIDKFHYEIIEEGVENYDEREWYWIKVYQSIAPNGYNVAPGGTGTGAGIESVNSVFKDRDALMRCVSLISCGKKTFTNIAREFGCSIEVIISINNGERYRLDGFEYPLRNTRYSTDLLKQVRYSLKYEEDLTLQDIAKKYKIDYSQVSLINCGKIYYVDTEEYPLRKKRKKDHSVDEINAIIDDIQFSDLSLGDIAKKHNVSAGLITYINSGERHQRDGILYPIREYDDRRSKNKKKFLEMDTIMSIAKDLKSDMSIAAIAEKYGLSKTMIQNINNGKVKKYTYASDSYPIRDNRKSM